MWKSTVAICLGGSLGSVLRWWLGTKLNGYFPTVPPGTLAANLIGGYLIGLAVAFFASFSALAPEWRLFVITGFFGGLTPLFSVFAGALGPSLPAPAARGGRGRVPPPRGGLFVIMARGGGRGRGGGAPPRGAA